MCRGETRGGGLTAHSSNAPTSCSTGASTPEWMPASRTCVTLGSAASGAESTHTTCRKCRLSCTATHEGKQKQKQNATILGQMWGAGTGPQPQQQQKSNNSNNSSSKQQHLLHSTSAG
jgi:hypothetical protein